MSENKNILRGKPTDAVDYIDSKGTEHPNEKLNYYWDLEPIHIMNIVTGKQIGRAHV